MAPVIFADLRCLQDKDYQRRGIGYHAAEILRTRKKGPLASSRTVGLIDPQMPRIPDDLADVVDEFSRATNLSFGDEPGVYVEGSPMTHDSRFALRLLSQPNILTSAVIYDFIPLDWPGYLTTVPLRISYSARLAHLAGFSSFFPISNYAALRASQLIGVTREKMTVTGACVRRSLYEARSHCPEMISPYAQAEPYFVTLGGDDRRKNTDVAVRAVRYLNLLYGRRIPLKVIGFYCDEYKSDLLKIAGHEEDRGFLEFYPSISDSMLISLHLGALAAICPSRIEGFSLPIPEAALAGCPVIASTCAAQMELVARTEAIFHSEDDRVLADRLEAIISNPSLREQLVKDQSHLAEEFHADRVGERFWNALEREFQKFYNARRRCYGNRGVKVALFTSSSFESTLGDRYGLGILKEASGKVSFEIYASSDAVEMIGEQNNRLPPAMLIRSNYGAIVSSFSNVRGQAGLLQFFLRYGGPCILHDVRMVRTYFELLGPKKFVDLAGKFLKRSVTLDEAMSWLADPNCSLLFLDDLIGMASPLIVQTVAQRELVEKLYGLRAQVLTSCPNFVTMRKDIERDQATARQRLGIAEESYVISVFGIPSLRITQTSIIALELLRAWQIPAQLYFIGDQSAVSSEIERIAELYDISEYVYYGSRFATANAYQEFLVASDAASQIREYSFGTESKELLECIAAGLPSVTTTDLSIACDVPDYIRSVPDIFSPLLVAEELAEIFETRRGRGELFDSCFGFLETHNFAFYAKRLVEVLGV